MKPLKTFDSAFFSQLAALDDYTFTSVQPRDGLRLRVSELQPTGKISSALVSLTQDFTFSLARCSRGRYVFEEDFYAGPNKVYNFGQGQSRRKQLHVRFDATPPDSIFSHDWGVSIGLGFDFRNWEGISAECVDEYDKFFEKVFVEPELFDATFGSLGGYAEPTEDFKEPVTAEKAWQTTPDMLQSWLFFGKRLTPDDIIALGSLDDFADECIMVFDAITDAGY